jgi:hypothetical protein
MTAFRIGEESTMTQRIQLGRVYYSKALRKESAGDYQIGIWSVCREGRKWLAVSTGPGTLGDGSPHYYPTLRAAYLALTGEPR